MQADVVDHHQGFDAYNFAKQAQVFHVFTELGFEKLMIYVEVFDFDRDEPGRADC
jgi:hypothetical protein